MKIVLGEEKLVFCAPKNSKTDKWGVYCLPRLWREPSGRLVIQINGDADSAVINQDLCPDLFFASNDQGQTWESVDGNQIDMSVHGSVDSPYLFLEDKTIAVREKSGRKPVTNAKNQKRLWRLITKAK